MNTQSNTKAFLFSIGSITLFIGIFMLLSQLKTFLPPQFERYAHGIAGTISAFGAIWLFAKIEKSSFKNYGLYWDRSTLRNLLIGLFIGFTIALLMIFSQIFYSDLVLTRSKQELSTFLLGLPAILILAYMEEVAFRSYAFIKLNKAFGIRATQLIVAILFALYHVLNGWSLALAFIGPGIWALLYGLAAASSKGIALPTGLHAGVNMVLALFVGKTNLDSLWTIHFAGDPTTSQVNANEQFGLITHIVLLLIGVIGTELYSRKFKKTINK